MKKPLHIIVTVTLIAIMISPVWADTLYLKNGHQIEGVIQEEKSDQIIFDVGFGTVTLQKTEILKIERSEVREKEVIVQQQRTEYFETGRWVPQGAEELFERFKKIRDEREDAFRAKSRKEALLVKQTNLETEIASLKQKYSPLSEELKTVYPKKAIFRHNKLVKEMNVLSATIQAEDVQLEDLNKQVVQTEQKIHHYLNAYREFKQYALEKLPSLRSEQGGEKEKGFYDGIEKTIAEMDGDFIQEAVTSRRQGPNLLVDAVLNDKVIASLMVDTGASLTVISKNIADRLGINQKSVLGEIDAVVADGRVVKAKAILLDSIAVGKARVERSIVAVLPTSESKMDGLLGMSFLKNFVVQVDAKNDLLILERLK